MKKAVTYNFNHKSGKVFKVKFYPTGVYSITDSKGEHKLGMWEKKPLLVGRYSDKPSKDPYRVIYFGTSFSKNHTRENSLYRVAQYTMREMAYYLLLWETLSKTIETCNWRD